MIVEIRAVWVVRDMRAAGVNPNTAGRIAPTRWSKNDPHSILLIVGSMHAAALDIKQHKGDSYRRRMLHAALKRAWELAAQYNCEGIEMTYRTRAWIARWATEGDIRHVIEMIGPSEAAKWGEDARTIQHVTGQIL